MSEFSYSVAMRFTGTEPVAGSSGAAAYDLYAAEDALIEADHHALVRTNLRVEIPRGIVGEVCSRSGLANKEGIFVLNSPGLIDSDFRGEICVILMNTQHRDYRVKAGERVAQIKFSYAIPVSFIRADSLEQTERGENGFGSSGK